MPDDRHHSMRAVQAALPCRKALRTLCRASGRDCTYSPRRHSENTPTSAESAPLRSHTSPCHAPHCPRRSDAASDVSANRATPASKNRCPLPCPSRERDGDLPPRAFPPSGPCRRRHTHVPPALPYTLHSGVRAHARAGCWCRLQFSYRTAPDSIACGMRGQSQARPPPRAAPRCNIVRPCGGRAPAQYRRAGRRAPYQGQD